MAALRACGHARPNIGLGNAAEEPVLNVAAETARKLLPLPIGDPRDRAGPSQCRAGAAAMLTTSMRKPRPRLHETMLVPPIVSRETP